MAAESAPEDGALGMERPVGAGAAFPKSDFGALSAEGAGVVDSAGLFLSVLPKRPPPAGAEGVALPNKGFCAVFPPNRLGVDDGCEVPPRVGVVEEVVAGADEVLEFNPPKRPPGFCAVCPKSDGPEPAEFPWGGGPAGVVDVFPKSDPPDCPGVDEVLPNREPAGFDALFPKRPPELGVSVGLGVCDDPVPNKELVWPVGAAGLF